MSVPREIAPVLILGAGLMGAVLWSGIVGGRPALAPPYLVSQGLLMLAGFTMVRSGAPRWSYPWLAFGVVATNALLAALVASGDDPSALTAIVAVATGPVLAVLLATVISVRSWGDAYTFLGLFLAGIVVSWLMVGPPGSPGAATEGALGQMLALLVVLPVLGTVISMAVLAWNRRVTEIALLLLGSVLMVSAVGFDVMIPDATDPESDPPNFASFLSLYLFLAMATFAAGSIRRVFAGKGMVSQTPVSGAPSPAADASEDRESAPGEPATEAGENDRARIRRRRRRTAEQGPMAQGARRRRRR